MSKMTDRIDGYNISPEIAVKVDKLLQDIEQLSLEKAQKEIDIKQLQTELIILKQEKADCLADTFEDKLQADVKRLKKALAKIELHAGSNLVQSIAREALKGDE